MSALALAGCTNSAPASSAAGSSAAASSAAASSAVDPIVVRDAAYAAFPSAIDKSIDNDAIGFVGSNLNFKVAAKANAVMITEDKGTSDTAVSSTPTYTHAALGADLSLGFTNGQYALLAQGLKSNKVEDLKASLTASGDAAFSLATTMNNEKLPISGSFAQAKVALGAYISNGQTYADFSDANLVKFTNTIIDVVNMVGAIASSLTPSDSTSDGETTSTFSVQELVAGKYILPPTVSADALPVISDKTVASVTSAMSKFADIAPMFKDYSTATLADGLYTVKFALTLDNIEKLVIDSVMKAEPDTSETQLKMMVSAIGSMFTVNAFDVSFAFSADKGLVNLTPNIDLAFASDWGTIAQLAGADPHNQLTTVEKALKETGSIVLNGSVDLKYGSAVAVTLPSDLSSYVSTKKDTPVAQ
jgi:hypothetical protein